MKDKVVDLAFFGGMPEFSERIVVGRPNIINRDRFLSRVNEALDRKWVTNNGPLVQELEGRISELSRVRNTICFCNATAAIEVASRAMGMRGEVIVPSMTYVATAHALYWQGMRPVFCDIEERNLCIDPDKVEGLMTKKTHGMIGVHLFGRICNVERLKEISERRKLPLLYDAAHAFGCSYKGIPVGSYGDAEVFSFHATKFFNTFEGGAVTTDDDGLARRIRSMRSFGIGDGEKVESEGINGKMTEISAAMGLSLLENLDVLVETNRRNYLRYRQGLKGVPGIRVLEFDEGEKCNYQYITLVVEGSESGIDRDLLYDILEKENIITKKYFHPGVHNMEPYRSLRKGKAVDLPVTERYSHRLLTVPNGLSVGVEDIDRVCSVISFVLHNSEEIGRKAHG